MMKAKLNMPSDTRIDLAITNKFILQRKFYLIVNGFEVDYRSHANALSIDFTLPDWCRVYELTILSETSFISQSPWWPAQPKQMLST